MAWLQLQGALVPYTWLALLMSWAWCRVAGIDVDVQEVQIVKQQHKQPEYLKTNPLGKIPALKASGARCRSPTVS